ncbi:hypothetical protein O6H91_11G004000 [Diphasiastrum complanatum]|uniref:Uncharacterized protein n=1 Tax=Diphasiastrum complanatum TaxID=34168 RepID=A0ACC2C5W5_DIPCM|nr:hypothetical protein O6H91_11G004000 [Diphasiastrum complanatum]
MAKMAGPSWQSMMDRSAPNMTYEAWRRDLHDGPTEYRSRTIYEDVSPQMIKDFFWDDEFRLKWDNMILSAKTLEECPKTGSMTVHWVRKFPFFCKDREYIIARRIWNSGDVFYCIQKGVDHISIPRQIKPRRVDIFYSSFRIRAVESQKASGQFTSCEVLLFHHEEMGIQRDIAKLGVRQGMWGCVKMIEAGVRKYISLRNSGNPSSRSALMAQICTQVPNYLLTDSNSSRDEVLEEKKHHAFAWKLVVLGGAVALACGVDRGAVGRVLLFGIVRRLGRLGRRL